MPIEFSIFLERDLVYAGWWGDIDYDQFSSNFQTYLKDKHYLPGRTELIDLSGVISLDVNFNLARSILRQVNNQSSKVKVTTQTVVYAPQETVYGIGRMYQALAENAQGIRVDLFRTEAEALQHLELPYDSIADLLDEETFHRARNARTG